MISSKNEAPGELARPGAWRITIWKTILFYNSVFHSVQEFFFNAGSYYNGVNPCPRWNAPKKHLKTQG